MLRRTKPMMRRKPLRAKPSATPDARAKACRRLQTALLEHPVGRLKFHPQARLGPFTVDFHCPGARLVLLLADDSNRTDDAASWLRDNGYRVLEFPVGEVLNNTHSILDIIAQSFELRIIPRQN